MRTEVRITPEKREPRKERPAIDRAGPRTSVIIPAYNEEEGLPIVLGKLLSVIDETYEVIVVDDGSTDGTRDVAAAFPCRLMPHASNQGKGQAMKTGIRAARGENLIFIDADDTYPAELIPRMAGELNRVDMVVGSRKRGKEQIPAFNRVGNAIFRGAIRHLYGFKAHDPLTGLYGIRKTHLNRMRLDSDGFSIEAEIAIKAARMGLRISDTPIEYGSRAGEAKLRGLQDGYRIFQTIAKMLALYNPTGTFILPGGVLFGLGLFVMTALLAGGLSIGGLALGINSFTLAAMLSLAGFQLGVFGFALNLYGVAHKFTKPNVLTRLLLRDHMGRNFVLVGLVLVGVGVALAAWEGPGWLTGEVQAAGEAERLVLMSFLGVLGIQILVSSLFLSIFAKEVADSTAQVGAGQDVPLRPAGIAMVPQASPSAASMTAPRRKEDTRGGS
jgi:glycosyltransferase involved in cell wall biosynthesis